MGKAMRRLLTFACEGSTLAASLDPAAGETGVLMVTGGSQTRIGSHRMYERLAAALAAQGFFAFRFDRRGVGDSEGADPGFRGSAPDIGAAADAFRRECPQIVRIVGFGLCDGATALALFSQSLGLQGLILVNPWLIETGPDAPAAAAIKRRYRQRLLSVEGWRKLLSGSISWRKLLKGLRTIATPRGNDLAADVAEALETAPPARLILARGDATAIAAEAEWTSTRFASVCAPPLYVESDSHTFAKSGDDSALLAACLKALRSF